MGEIACAEEDAGRPCEVEVRAPRRGGPAAAGRARSPRSSRRASTLDGWATPGANPRPWHSTAPASRRGAPSAAWPRPAARPAGIRRPLLLQWTNRLSDLLWLLAREAESLRPADRLKSPGGRRQRLRHAARNRRPRPRRGRGACSRSTCRRSAIFRRSWRLPSARAPTRAAAGCGSRPSRPSSLSDLYIDHYYATRLPLRVERGRGGPADPLLRGGTRDRCPRLPPAQLAEPARRRARRLGPLLPRDEHGLVERRRRLHARRRRMVAGGDGRPPPVSTPRSSSSGTRS